LPQTIKYANVLTRIGAQRATLLGVSKLKMLTEASTLEELVSQLRDSSYQSRLQKVAPPYDSRQLEWVFKEAFFEAAIKVTKNAPKSVAPFLKMFLKQFEVENLKALIKAAHVDLEPEQVLSKVSLQLEAFLGNRDAFEEAAKANGITQRVNALAKTEYATALAQGLASYNETGAVACFDVLLDKVYFENLYEAYFELSHVERKHAQFYVETLTAKYVLPMILRAKNLNYETSALRVIIPDQTLGLSKATLEELVEASDYEVAHNIVMQTPFGQYFPKTASAEETIANAETALRKALTEHAEHARVFEIFNIGLPLSFLILKQTEATNLTTISIGIESKLAPEEIARRLFLPS
jgi:vacuolar-type H+-ATPase subunit C/Vma6